MGSLLLWRVTRVRLGLHLLDYQQRFHSNNEGGADYVKIFEVSFLGRGKKKCTKARLRKVC
jgi:hypothetical protein